MTVVMWPTLCYSDVSMHDTQGHHIPLLCLNYTQRSTMFMAEFKLYNVSLLYIESTTAVSVKFSEILVTAFPGNLA